MTELRFIMMVALITLMVLLSPTSARSTDNADTEPVLSVQFIERNVPPKIVRLGAVLYNGVLYVVGAVADPDDDPGGQTVFIGGSVVGTTYVTSNGLFHFRIPYHYPFGEVTARTIDRRGAESYTEILEFAE